MIAEPSDYIKISKELQKRAKEESSSGRPLLHCSRSLITLIAPNFNRRLRKRQYPCLIAKKFQCPVDFEFLGNSPLYLIFLLGRTAEEFKGVIQ